MSTTSENGPPPVKKVKQSTLAFHTTAQLASSSLSTSQTSQKNTDILRLHPDEETACTSECCARASDEQEPTPFQPKDQSTRTYLSKARPEKSLLFSNVVCYLSLDNALYYESSCILCLLPLLCGNKCVFGSE